MNLQLLNHYKSNANLTAFYIHLLYDVFRVSTTESCMFRTVCWTSRGNPSTLVTMPDTFYSVFFFSDICFVFTPFPHTLR